MAATPKPTSSAPTTKKPRSTKRKPKRHHHDDNHNTITTTATATVSSLIPTITYALSHTQSFTLNHDLQLLPSQFLTLESSLHSASSYLSKIQTLLKIKQPQQIPFPISPYSNCWFERFLLSASIEQDPRWLQTFRMSKPTFLLLNAILSHYLSSSIPSISPNFALGAALYRLAHNGSFSSVGKRFGISSQDACRAFYAVCKMVCDHLGGYLGDFGSEMGRILVGFEGISLPNCCGVLGFGKFPVEGGVLGENGFLMVQALVDSDGRFLDVSAGWPSTFKPDLVLQQTRLFSGVEESKELLNGLALEISDGILVPQYILGDCCYPLFPWLLTPFLKRGEDLSLKEKVFNEVHKRAMGFLVVAFGRVRANWKLLNRSWKEDCIEFLPFVITTACLLNNFLMKHGEKLSDGEPGLCVEAQDMPVYDGETNESAGRTRDLLASYLSLHFFCSGVAICGFCLSVVMAIKAILNFFPT